MQPKQGLLYTLTSYLTKVPSACQRLFRDNIKSWRVKVRSQFSLTEYRQFVVWLVKNCMFSKHSPHTMPQCYWGPHRNAPLSTTAYSGLTEVAEGITLSGPIKNILYMRGADSDLQTSFTNQPTNYSYSTPQQLFNLIMERYKHFPCVLQIPLRSWWCPQFSSSRRIDLLQTYIITPHITAL